MDKLIANINIMVEGLNKSYSDADYQFTLGMVHALCNISGKEYWIATRKGEPYKLELIR